MKRMVWWSALIAITLAVYSGIFGYLHVGPYLWMTFVSYSTFFLSGAAVKDIPRFWASSMLGVAAGRLGLQIITWLSGAGWNIHLILAVSVGFVSLVVCLIGLVFLPKARHLLNVVPMMFGGILSVYAMSSIAKSANWTQFFYVCGTLTLGVLMAALGALTLNLAPAESAVGKAGEPQSDRATATG